MAKNPWAVKLGRRGGQARAAVLTPERRSQIAKLAVAVRDNKQKFARVEGRLVPQFTEKSEFLAWLRTAKKGDQATYFIGELAAYRQTAAARIVELEKLSDKARPSHPRPPAEAVEIELLRARLDLAASVSSIAQTGLLHLTQKRHEEFGWYYVATRTGAR